MTKRKNLDSAKNSTLRVLGLLLGFWAASLTFPSIALAEASDIRASSRGVVRVVIIGTDGDELIPISHGSGFVVENERIITNAHVVREAVDDKRLSIGIIPPEGGDAVYARLVSISLRNDLALLATTEPMNLPPLSIAGNSATVSGEVTSIGYPSNVDRAQGLRENDIFRATPPVTSTGFLSGRRPSRDFDTLLHTAPIARGNSGGPLVDECGRVIGVNSFGAESTAAEAEFFFAISTRELLPFLRANDVKPRINSLACRSIADLDEQQSAREAQEQAQEQARVDAEEEALAKRATEIRRDLTFAAFEERSNFMALALMLFMICIAAAAFGVLGHIRNQPRMRAIAGSVAIIALFLAVIAWMSRPSFDSIDGDLEDFLRGEAEGEAENAGEEPPASGTINLSTNGEGQNYSCSLDQERSRAVGAATPDITLQWSETGCVNERTQYGQEAGRWLRAFAPQSDAAISVNSFDPEAEEYVMERYLLDRDALTQARKVRGEYAPPLCSSGLEAARTFGVEQATLIASLPQSPDERLVYKCRAVEGEAE